MKTSKVVLILVFALLSAGTLTTTAIASKPAPVTVQILAVNDFHGALDPSLTKPNSTNQSTWYYRGGAEYLANFVKDASVANPNTLMVSAGDTIGASPLLSTLFHDEPTVMAFNLMGFDFNVPGRHEFDEGWHELLRMQDGGCHPTDGCFSGVPEFPGATFKYLAGNVVRLDNGQTLFSAYGVRQYNGVKVGIIGVTLETMPTITASSAVEGLEFEAEVNTINYYVKVLKDMEGVKAIIVLLHDGASAGPTINACNTSDPFFSNVVMKIDPEVDALITGYTHNVYNCQVEVKHNYDPILVTSAGYNGYYMTAINLTIDGTNGQVIAKSATNIRIDTPYLNAVPDPDMKALLDQYRTASAPLANRVVGSITADITRTANGAGESALGDVITDAQLYETKGSGSGNAVIAMTNPGGIRMDLLYNQISGGENPGEITYAEAFGVQPFGNRLVTMTLTGAQIKAVLEQQFVGCGQPSGGQKILQVSDGFSYSWSSNGPACNKISTINLSGNPINPYDSYRVTVNDFLAGGGDNFSGFKSGTDLTAGAIDLDAFLNYLLAKSPVAPGPQNRITMTMIP